MDIFLAAPPGLEPLLLDEATQIGLERAEAVPGGVLAAGDWPDIWRANLLLRGAGRVLVRIGAFHAVHLAQLDKRAHRIDWGAILPPGTPVRVDAVCERSRIWHAGAAAQRIERAVRDALGPASGASPLRILVRLVEDRCTISLDTSGEPLHRRGSKQAIGKAPLRETLAALFLRACGFRGDEPVLDPMCGSGTFVLEAAEIACGLAPGRARSFAFEGFPSFDPAAWERLRQREGAAPPAGGPVRFFGFDRDAGAVAAASANAGRAGLDRATAFHAQPISALEPPGTAGPGLVIVNPPYGDRIGARGELFALYATLGRVLLERFAGWRVGLVTSEPALARATALPFLDLGRPVPHGGLRIRLYRTAALGRAGKAT